jgi:hypothetical protein
MEVWQFFEVAVCIHSDGGYIDDMVVMKLPKVGV